jgi:uncharacterized protein YfaS (alpha-2-macroglobulin family)
VHVTVTLKEGTAQQTLLDLGLPPGFELLAEDLATRIAHDSDMPETYTGARLSRFERTGRQILVYVQNFSAGEPLTFSYRLRARFPLVAQTPPSSAYDYYNPEVQTVTSPVAVVVNP